MPLRNESILPEHLLEVAEILAAGLMRLEARKSSPNSSQIRESSLHLKPPESGVRTRRFKETQR